MKRLTPLVALVALSAVSLAQTPAASHVMAGAYAEAKATKRNVFVVFHASWCGWCKKLDAFMQDKQFAPLFAKDYVVVHLDVLEQPDKKHLENDGAGDLMKLWGGEGAGLPFLAILNPDAKLLANSMRPENWPFKEGQNKPNPDPRPVPGKGKNTGHPAAPEEVSWFIEMLHRSAPRMTDEDIAKIEKFLRSQKFD